MEIQIGHFLRYISHVAIIYTPEVSDWRLQNKMQLTYSENKYR